MAKRANIHELRGACASLEVHFSWDVEDEVEDYSDANSKLDLARQLEEEFNDPNGEWMELSKTARSYRESGSWLRMIADSAYEAGRIAGEQIADDKAYADWSSVLEPNHVLRKAYDAIVAKHQQCAATELTQKTTIQHCSSTISTLREEMRQLRAQAEEHITCTGILQSLIDQLSQSNLIAEKHTTCGKVMDTLIETVRSLKPQAESHKSCAGKIQSMVTQLKETKKDYEGRVQEISDLKTQIQQLESSRPPDQALSHVQGRPEVDNDESRHDVLQQDFDKICAQFDLLCKLTAMFLTEHVHRESTPVAESYRSLAQRLETWKISHFAPDNFSEATRQASFGDFVRELVIGFDMMIKLYRESIQDADQTRTEAWKVHKDLETLKTERDLWKDECMEILDKAQSAQVSHDANGEALAQELAADQLLLAELQQLLTQARLAG